MSLPLNMIDNNTVQKITLIARRIIESESRHNFDTYAIDDGEHIPRMKRIANAAKVVSIELGLASDRCDAIRDDLIEYARQLYVAEWMRPQPGDETPAVKEEAIQQFNLYLKGKKK